MFDVLDKPKKPDSAEFAPRSRGAFVRSQAPDYSGSAPFSDALPPAIADVTRQRLPISDWIRRIEDDSAADSSPRTMRRHALYKLILKQGPSIVDEVLKNLTVAPLTTISLAQQLVDPQDSPVRDEDRGDVHRLMLRWLLWAKGRQTK